MKRRCRHRSDIVSLVGERCAGGPPGLGVPDLSFVVIPDGADDGPAVQNSDGHVLATARGEQLAYLFSAYQVPYLDGVVSGDGDGGRSAVHRRAGEAGDPLGVAGSEGP